MVKQGHRPELIIIAGPNGSGKTSVTRKFLHHEWAEGTIYINPDEVAKEKFGDWNSREAIISAANYCAQWREECLSNKTSFVFETVMSAEDKIDFIIRAIENCRTIAPIVDRLYVYDNSVDGHDATIQFRLANGELAKLYVENIPDWAKSILDI